MGKTTTCPLPTGSFKSCALLFFILTFICLFYISYLISNIISIEFNGWVGKGVVAKSNGTWVRIPGPPYICYYFPSGIPVYLMHCSLLWTSNFQAPDGLQAKSEGQDWKLTIFLSQQAHVGWQKSARLICIWASKMLFSHSNQAHTPFGYFFLFILFILFVCFILLLVLKLTN